MRRVGLTWKFQLGQHDMLDFTPSLADREIQRRAKVFLLEGEATKSFHWLADRAR